ncbi:MAG TPA: SDR family NAD(P)-dependent oxidoreductase, partial [Archangium sp.]
MSDVFLVTGCASGIGRHLTRALSSLGHQVMATDVNEAGLEAAAKANGWQDARVARRRLDVREQGEWEGALAATLQRFGRCEVLLNVAGY